MCSCEETLAYSCAYWPSVASDAAPLSLADAQRAKLERLCGWLELSQRDHLLEIGCGWGGMAIHAAATRGCRVTAITVSKEQDELARARVAAAGLAERVTIAYRDERELTGSFDKLVSIERLEQVGYAFLPDYFDTCARLLAPGGRLAVQTITMPDDRFDVRTDDIGPGYAQTLAIWRERFVAALPEVRALGFDTPFIRTWMLYLAFSEAAFAERTLADHSCCSFAVGLGEPANCSQWRAQRASCADFARRASGTSRSYTGAPDARPLRMATTHPSPYQLHDHAGARWLATAAAPVLLLILAVIAMLAYPHI